jgi:hypothetical protein
MYKIQDISNLEWSEYNSLVYMVGAMKNIDPVFRVIGQETGKKKHIYTQQTSLLRKKHKRQCFALLISRSTS